MVVEDAGVNYAKWSHISQVAKLNQRDISISPINALQNYLGFVKNGELITLKCDSPIKLVNSKKLAK